MYRGERAVPHALLGVTVAQGAAAYRFVASKVAGRRVLDVACGDGYGSALLAEQAAEVLAVDRDRDVIARAAAQYPKRNLKFRCLDVSALPEALGKGRFDAVCAFQFLEHVGDQAALLHLLASLVRPGGLLAVSTPNRRCFPTFNPYHLHEFDADELRALAARLFPAATLYGVFGDDSVLTYRRRKQRLGDMLLRLDVLRARQWLPRVVVQRLYDVVSWFVLKRAAYWQNAALVHSVTVNNFHVSAQGVERALDLLLLVALPGAAATSSTPASQGRALVQQRAGG